MTPTARPDPGTAYRAPAAHWPVRPRRIGAGLLLIVLLLLLGAILPTGGRVGEGRARAAGHAAIVRRGVVARPSRCDHPAESVLTYAWPLRPFDQQHPIRGNFGDPRTLAQGLFGLDTSRTSGDFSFHNGVDIAAPAGTLVFPVVSGVVADSRSDEIVIRSDDARTFQYWHLIPRVTSGERVDARETVLGTVAPEFDHVHLSEIDGFRIHNPVDPGHLEPYHDHTVPEVGRFYFRGVQGDSLDREHLHGQILIDADASDTPPLPVAGAWSGFPVTPALLAWHLTTEDGRVVVPQTTVADFRQTEPANDRFWQVYADGTYQNFPVFGHHYFWHQPGRYLFNLTASPLDTNRLPNGAYRITVDAADVCGNHSSLSESIRIHN